MYDVKHISHTSSLNVLVENYEFSYDERKPSVEQLLVSVTVMPRMNVSQIEHHINIDKQQRVLHTRNSHNVYDPLYNASN